MKKKHTTRIDVEIDPVGKSMADAAANGEPGVLGLPNGWDRLTEARKRAGMTQEQLGAKIGVSSVTLSRWEKSDHLPESAIPFILLAKYLDVSLDWLLYNDGDVPALSPAEREVLEQAGMILAKQRMGKK